MELDEGFKLCSGRCIGARPGKEKNELLLTFDVGSVQIYDGVSHSCVHSWQVPSDHCLCSPAIYHSQSGNYWALRSNRGTHTSNSTPELLSWGSDGDMMAGKSVALPQSNVFTLLDVCTTDSPAVVYSNGGVAMGGANPRLPETERDRSQINTKVLAADRVHCGDTEHVCTVSVASDDASNASISLWSMSEGQAKPLVTSSLTDSSPVIACCVCGVSLITVASDGRLYCWNILDALHSQPLRPIHRSTLTPPPVKPVHLVSLSCDYFAVMSVTSERTRLSIWDVAYLTNQASSTLSDASSHLMCCLCGCVLVCGRESVTLINTRERNNYGTLAAALGRGQSSTAFQTLSKSSVEEHLREEMPIQKDVLTILTDRDKTPTLEQFMKEFVELPELDYSVVVQRLLGETEFWARDALLRLLQDNVFPSSLVGELLEAALEKKDWALVSVVLSECCDCIPESILVRLLEASLKLPDSLDGTLSREHLLVSLLNVPVNDALLHLPLSQLSFHSVIVLLEWLCHRVDMSQLLTTPTHPISSHQLSYDCILDWISVLVDVHFTQLSLQPQARHLLIKLHSTVFKQVKCLDHLSIVGATQHMNKATPTNSDNWLYKIEKLPINI